MKNIPKAGLLIVTLVIPALIFLFLRIFATNHYNLPYLNPEVNANGVVLVVNGDTTFAKVEKVCGSAYGDSKLTVLSRLPVVCGESCQIVLASLQRVVKLSEDIHNLQVVTLIDSNQLPEGLPVEFGKTNWIAKNSSDTISDQCFSAAAWTSNDKERKPISPENRLMLIDDKGYFRGYYDGGQEEEIDRLMAEIKILNYEKENSEK